MAKFALKAHALGDPECRDDTPFDLLAGLSSSFACPPILSSGLIEVGDKSVAFDGCRFKQGHSLSRAVLASSIRSIRASRFISCIITIQYGYQV